LNDYFFFFTAVFILVTKIELRGFAPIGIMGELVLNEVEGKEFFTIKMVYFRLGSGCLILILTARFKPRGIRQSEIFFRQITIEKRKP
jgi:hypothetical protein